MVRRRGNTFESMVISIKVVGQERVMRTIKRVGMNLNKLSKKQGKETAEIAADSIRRQLAKNKFTGYSSSKRGTKAVKKGANKYAVVTPYYVDYLEKGARGHLTRAPKAIRWAQQKGGGMIRGPGGGIKIRTRPRRPIAMGVASARGRIRNYLKSSTSRYVNSRGNVIS